jgi:hypothetical protein
MGPACGKGRACPGARAGGEPTLVSSLTAGAASTAQLNDRTNRIARHVGCIKIAFDPLLR